MRVMRWIQLENRDDDEEGWGALDEGEETLEVEVLVVE